MPAEVDATAILLNRSEARRLIAWLKERNISRRIKPHDLVHDRDRERGRNGDGQCGIHADAGNGTFELGFPEPAIP